MKNSKIPKTLLLKLTDAHTEFHKNLTTQISSPKSQSDSQKIDHPYLEISIATQNFTKKNQFRTQKITKKSETILICHLKSTKNTLSYIKKHVQISSKIRKFHIHT